MNDYDFGEAMKEVRNARIEVADQQVITKFSRLPPALYSPKRQVGRAKITHNPASNPVNKKVLHFGTFNTSLFIGLAGLLFLCLVVDIVFFGNSLLAKSGNSEYVPAHTTTGAGIIIQKPIINQTIIINQTSIIERVSLGSTEDCNAIKWIENGINKSRYDCEEQK